MKRKTHAKSNIHGRPFLRQTCSFIDQYKAKKLFFFLSFYFESLIDCEKKYLLLELKFYFIIFFSGVSSVKEM